MWGFRVEYKLDDGGGVESSNVVAFPCECKKCPTAIKERHGCGHYDRYRGLAAIRPARGDPRDPINRTCQRFFVEADADVQYLLWTIEDYRRGALGPVGALPANLVDAYRLFDSEWSVWQDKQQPPSRR